MQPQLLCRGEDTFWGTKPPWGVRGVAALTPPCCSVYCPAGCKDIEGDIWGNAHQGYRDVRTEPAPTPRGDTPLSPTRGWCLPPPSCCWRGAGARLSPHWEGRVRLL